MLFAVPFVHSQTDSNTVLGFDFNDHTFNESSGRSITQAVGVSLVEDRFGNPRSALYLQGHTNSYLILGTSSLLKPEKGTISLWVKLERKVFAGKGYECNPIIITRRSNNADFYDAYTMFYDFKSERLMVFFSKDSTEQTGINSLQPFVFNQWYHLVFTYNNASVAFYINGVKQGESAKNFGSVFLKDSPVYVGHSGSTKNERRSRGSVDDIQIFHRVLSPAEINELYNAPNPNRAMAALVVVLRWLLVAALIFAIAFMLVWQRRKALKREKEKFELNNRLHEMEIRTLKAQMNPHFIFNSLSSIQQLIMSRENETAEEYLAKFAQLLRRLLESNANESITVKEEVEILNDYLEIEKLRFESSFDYVIAVDEKISTAETCIPHLMIQPFIENAIWHGLLPKKGGGELRVNFEFVDSLSLRCVVDDNGIGRGLSSKKTDTFKKRSLALSFVKQRLELMSKTLNVACSVEIIDKMNTGGESAGTRVVVVIPILKTIKK